MAQPGGYYQSGNNNGPAPYGPLFVLGIVALGLILPWYLSYEPVVGEITQQVKVGVMLLPVLLLLALHFMSSSPSSQSSSSWLPLPSDPSSIHRLGGSPLGVGVVLFLILAMIWYQSDFLESWHPFVRS